MLLQFSHAAADASNASLISAGVLKLLTGFSLSSRRDVNGSSLDTKRVNDPLQKIIHELWFISKKSIKIAEGVIPSAVFNYSFLQILRFSLSRLSSTRMSAEN